MDPLGDPGPEIRKIKQTVADEAANAPPRDSTLAIPGVGRQILSLL